MIFGVGSVCVRKYLEENRYLWYNYASIARLMCIYNMVRIVLFEIMSFILRGQSGNPENFIIFGNSIIQIWSNLSSPLCEQY